MRILVLMPILIGMFVFAGGVRAQDVLDRADPAIVEEQLEPEIQERPGDSEVAIPVAEVSAGAIPAGSVTLGAVRIEGTGIARERFAPIIGRYVGRTVNNAELQELTNSISETLRMEGFVFARVWIAPQRISTGILTISVDEGAVDEIRYTGVRHAAVERLLAPIANGTPVMRDELERRLLLADDIPGIRISTPRYLRSGDRGVLQVSVTQDRVRGYARLDNNGSESIGPWRSRGTAEFRSLAISGDELSVTGVTTPFEPGDFFLGSAEYDLPLGDDGMRATLRGYVAVSDPDSRFARIIDGDSIGVSGGLAYPLVRSRDFSLWGTGQFGYRRSMQDVNGLAVREDRVTTAEFGFDTRADLFGGYWDGAVHVVQGLGLFGSTQQGDPLASRSDGSGRFTKFELEARWFRRLGSGFSLEITGEGQIAMRPLLSGEEFGIGGDDFGRGLDYYERSGENGIAGALEIRYDINDVSESVEKIQIYGYSDYAGVRNSRGGGGGGRLASAGGGVRAWIGDHVRLGVEAGVPLNADRFDSGNRSPRLRFVLTGSF